MQQGRSTLQGNHRQTAANLSEQVRHPGQMLVVPLRGNEFDDRVLGLLQPVTRFANDQLMNLRNIGGRQVARFAALLRGAADHAGQRSFDIEQRPGDIHQHGVVGRLLPLRYRLDEDDLIENDLARLGETEHCQGIGDLLERDLETGQFGNDLAIAAHEQVQAVLHPHQLFTKGSDHRAHRAPVGSRQLSTLLIDDGAVRQCFVEAVKLLERLDAGRLPWRLGDVEEQVLDQLIGRSLIEAISAFLDQSLELLVDLSQQGADRGTVAHAATGETFDHARGDLP